MRTNKLLQLVGFTLVTTLTACGGSDNVISPISSAGYANCVVPPGTQTSSVTGAMGGGAALQLQIYSQGGQTFSAVGMLTIPSVSQLYQNFGNVYQGSSLYGTSYGGASTPYGYGTTVGTGDSLQVCVSSSGAVGTMQTSSIYQNINVALQGTGVYINLGSQYGVQPYIENSSLVGSMYMQLQGQQAWVFPLTQN